MNKMLRGGVQQSNHRDSNIELFRIISMLLIVAHHYVVNSGLTFADGVICSDPLSWRSLFLLCFGAFGKIGINCFVFITGYFMCASNITLKKFCKLLFEVMFYKIFINLIFFITGYEQITLTGIVKVILPITQVAQNFTGTYLIFFLFIPFLNKLIHNLNEKQHVRLLFLSCFTYVFFGTLPFFSVTMNYVSWYMVLFVIASYVRLYPKEIYKKTRLWGVATLIFILLSLISVVSCTWIGTKIGKNLSYYFVTDSNTLLAVLVGVSSFMFFKNLKIEYHPFINLLAASTFGVLLIHANSDTMRQWLWKDTLNNVGMYSSKWMPFHAIGSVVGIFMICACIDYFRIRFIERPVFTCFDKLQVSIIDKYNKLENSICQKLNIK